MRVFVFEYVTGGGFLNHPLPEALRCEGDLMLRAVIRDLTELGHEVTILRDARLLPWEAPGAVTALHHSRELVPALFRQFEACDAVWPIAPETGGELERLADAVLAAGRTLLGCRPEAIAIAASKFETSARLAAADVPVVSTLRGTAVLEGEALPDPPWVIKPDEGAGCEETVLVRDADQLRRRIEAAPAPAKMIVQPYVDGVPASLSLLVGEVGCRLLTGNLQCVALVEDAFQFAGCVVAGLEADPDALQQLADRVTAAMPGLWGYVGVDLIMTAQGPLVLEVNPRLTTSYVGLSEALGINAAGLVLDLLAPTTQDRPVPRPRPVSIDLENFHAD